MLELIITMRCYIPDKSGEGRIGLTFPTHSNITRRLFDHPPVEGASALIDLSMKMVNPFSRGGGFNIRDYGVGSCGCGCLISSGGLAIRSWIYINRGIPNLWSLLILFVIYTINGTKI